MANIAANNQKLMLDWNLGATSGPASVTRPATVAVGLSLGAPTSVSMSEIGTASGYSVQTVSFSSASSPAGSTLNINAMTFGPFSSAQSISGVILKDTVSTGGGFLWFGTLTTARTVAIGDSLVIAASALVVTLS